MVLDFSSREIRVGHPMDFWQYLLTREISRSRSSCLSVLVFVYERNDLFSIVRSLTISFSIAEDVYPQGRSVVVDRVADSHRHCGNWWRAFIEEKKYFFSRDRTIIDELFAGVSKGERWLIFVSISEIDLMIMFRNRRNRERKGLIMRVLTARIGLVFCGIQAEVDRTCSTFSMGDQVHLSCAC
jgi:hypothetical protein